MSIFIAHFSKTRFDTAMEVIEECVPDTCTLKEAELSLCWLLFVHVTVT